MAIEDGAVLGNLLSHLSHPSQLPTFLQAYEDLRLPRTAETQNQSRLNQKIFHYPDGPEQEARDASMRAAMEAELAIAAAANAAGASGISEFKGEGNSNQWADRRKNEEQFGYDADKEAERWWAEKGERICRQAVTRAGAGITLPARM